MKHTPGLFILCLFILLSACKGDSGETQATDGSTSAQSAQTQDVSNIKVPKLSISQFEKMRRAGVELNVIDVRNPGEIRDGKIPDAMEIDYEDSDFEKNVDALDKNKTYILYCASGSRSHDAAQQMLQKGFKNVYNLEGGYEAWEKQVSQ